MKKHDFVDPKEMIALEEELAALKQDYGITEKERWWIKIGNWIAERSERVQRRVDRKTYIRLGLTCGWICGAHCFYAGQAGRGLLYLLFCWTGIPFAMTIIDLMIVIPMESGEAGTITL
ncbi:TM2 domain-containing protein [Lacrimispora sp.]|uniref:TM2 domain-containing protein n=1 Tax=Lacrimispora sp. TaxID=2719234 RepID=UPI003460E6DE